eukprot:4521536-Amphidinium_carterae.1
MRALNHYRSRHATLGATLPSAQMAAVKSIFRVPEKPAMMTEQEYTIALTKLFYCATHAVDPS